MLVTDYLQKGAKNAQTAKQLQSLLHVTGRQLSRMIRAERRAGSLICSRTSEDSTGKAGYFIATNADEVRHTLRQLASREKEIRQARQALEKALCKRIPKN